MDIRWYNKEKAHKSIYAVSLHLEYLWNDLRRFIQRLPTNVLNTGSPRVPARPSTLLPSMKNVSGDQRDTVF